MNNSDGGKDEQVHCMDNSGQWFRRPLGQAVLNAERFFACKVLPDLFGYHILQVGSPGEAQYLDCSRINHKVIIGSRRAQSTGRAHLICDQHALPVGSDSVDVMVLSHVLEFDPHPHQILREMERVLIGDGHVVIIGFNPWSLWGLWRLVNAWRDNPDRIFLLPAPSGKSSYLEETGFLGTVGPVLLEIFRRNISAGGQKTRHSHDACQDAMADAPPYVDTRRGRTFHEK